MKVRYVSKGRNIVLIEIQSNTFCSQLTTQIGDEGKVIVMALVDSIKDKKWNASEFRFLTRNHPKWGPKMVGHFIPVTDERIYILLSL